MEATFWKWGRKVRCESKVIPRNLEDILVSITSSRRLRQSLALPGPCRVNRTEAVLRAFRPIRHFAPNLTRSSRQDCRRLQILSGTRSAEKNLRSSAKKRTNNILGGWWEVRNVKEE